MDLLTQTKFLIKKTGLKPDKLKGQNFCIDQDVISQMVETAKLTKNDSVLEIGPGFGFLTQELVKIAKQVVAIEIEESLIMSLKKIESVNRNLKIVQGDALRMKVNDLGLKEGKYKIVANLPYSITSVFLRYFLTTQISPSAMTLLLQKEVAQRICADIGEMSLLAISVQLYTRPEIIGYVSKDSFWPKPAVDSAIIQIDKIKKFSYTDVVSEKKFWQIVKSGFCSKRKQLKNNLANGLHLPPGKISQVLSTAKINPLARAQELTISNWLSIAKNI